jgi:7-carboxy-7-deazaguanine synthase
MKIAEVFHSIQGEGLLAGIPSVFVRTSGCNLRCWFCDTPYSSWEPEGEKLDPAEILQQVLDIDCKHVVITGGEPMLWPSLVELVDGLRRAGRHVTVETAGTLDVPLVCDLASISPKLASSTPTSQENGRFALMHEQARWRPKVIGKLMDRQPYQLKFVAHQLSDLAEIESMLTQLPPIQPDRILLMPQGSTPSELSSRASWVANACLQRGWRYAPRLHIDLYGNTRGT